MKLPWYINYKTKELKVKYSICTISRMNQVKLALLKHDRMSKLLRISYLPFTRVAENEGHSDLLPSQTDLTINKVYFVFLLELDLQLLTT